MAAPTPPLAAPNTTPTARFGGARPAPAPCGAPPCWLVLAVAAALLAAVPAAFSVSYRTYAVTTGSGAIVVTGASSGIGAHAAEAPAPEAEAAAAAAKPRAKMAAKKAAGKRRSS